MSKRLFVHSRWSGEGDCEVLATVGVGEHAYFILTNESNKYSKQDVQIALESIIHTKRNKQNKVYDTEKQRTIAERSYSKSNIRSESSEHDLQES